MWSRDEETGIANESATEGAPVNPALSTAASATCTSAITSAEDDRGNVHDVPRTYPSPPGGAATFGKRHDSVGTGEDTHNGVDTSLRADPAGRYRVLAITSVAVVLGLATWFSATAVRSV